MHYTCDQCLQNMHSSHIHFCSFGDPQNHREWYTDMKLSGIVILQSVKISHLYIIPDRFYESPKLKIACMNYACFPKSDRPCSFDMYIILSVMKTFKTVR